MNEKKKHKKKTFIYDSKAFHPMICKLVFYDFERAMNVTDQKSPQEDDMSIKKIK